MSELMSGLAKIIRHEWRMLRADRTAWVVLALFALMIEGAILNVSATLREKQAAERQAIRDEAEKFKRFHAEAEEIERQAALRGQLAPQFQAEAKYWDKWGPRDSIFVGAWNAPRIVPPPSPFTILAIGQSDLFPSSYKVGIDGALEWQSRGRVVQQLDNPLLLKADRFDLAFVILYLYPMLILAISFNLMSGEKEGRTLGLLLAQPVSLRALVIGKVACRALLVFGGVSGLSLSGFLLSGTDFSGGGVRVLLWLVAVIVYGGFWFALAVVANAMGRSSAANALALAVAWLAFLFVIPSAISFAATVAYPVPPRIEYLNAARKIEDDVRRERKGLIAQYLREHPELSRWGWTMDNLGVGYPHVPEAMPEKVEFLEMTRRLQPVVARYEGQLAKQQALAARCRFLSPAVLMQGVLYDLAGTGRARHEHFLRQANAFNAEWNSFFDAKPFRREMVNAADYAVFPRFIYREESLGDVAGRAIVLLVALTLLPLALGWLGLRAYRHFPLAG
jgi:ABC-2 type transport system permease protein